MNASPTAAPVRAPLSALLDQFEEIVAGVAVAVIIASVSWGVVTRYVTAQPAAWASEVATLAFAWAIYFGGAACIKYRLFPTIEMVTERMPPALQTLVRRMNHVLLLAFFAFMTWFGVRFAIDTWDSPTAVLRLPQTLLYGPVAFCSALMALRYLQVMAGRRWDADEHRETHAG
ncbi:MAG: TRAP transporter small permease [Burkholderiales bacterium]|nr:MAG: TRAP transporter small permease [Burkholderiales bacterium]